MERRILILSCFTGEGHNSAAKAMHSAFDALEVPSRIMDPVSFQGKHAQHFISSFYNGMIRRSPGAFGALYKAGTLYDATGWVSPVYLANAAYAERLNRFLEAQRYTDVVCTHLYGMEAMTALKKRGKSGIPAYGIMTDYTCIPFLAETELDGYFTPHESLSDDLIRRGLPADKLHPFGIPVSPAFDSPLPRQEARARLGILEEKKLFLIMTGGVGCESLLGLCDAFLAAADETMLAQILVGHNESLGETIRERYGAEGQIRPVPFTDQVPVYMRAADVMLSKPGGLTSTEAAAANVPFVAVKAIPGCETCNAAFFQQHGMALSARDDAEAVAFAIQLAIDPERAERMRRAQRETLPAHAARHIAQFILNQ